MPTYQYRCADCGEERDVVQSFSDDALTVCPVCEGRLRKVFSAVGVVFKGSGFYRTDSRSSATPSGNGTGKSETNGSEGSDGSSSESSKSSDSGTQSDSGAKTDSTSKESKSGTKNSGSTTKQPSAA